MEVVVVGSLNEDLVVRVPHLPAAGETVVGWEHRRFRGGKGANQAVAAARLGARVAMVGRVGADDSGRDLIAALRTEGVDVSHVSVDPTVGTGLALIHVAGDGENTIALSPGANHTLSPDDVIDAREVIQEATVVLVQLEIRDESVTAAASLASGSLILNAAPARALYPGLEVDVLILNETELSVLTGSPVGGPVSSLFEYARPLAPTVVVTRGSKGAVLVTPTDISRFGAPVVDAVDTTGAGDAFCGALALGIARRRDLREVIRYAVAAGTAATLKAGAQSSLPYPRDVETLM